MSDQLASTQSGIVKEFFRNNPNRDIDHRESVPWLEAEYRRRTGKPFRDVDRGIRLLRAQGFLIKVRKGVYRYDPQIAQLRKQEEFSQAQKDEIFQRDGYRCVICGRGKGETELHADHIRPREAGGRAIVENGQTLCQKHNNLKRHLKQTETGKKFFLRLRVLAKKEGNDELVRFVDDVLAVYDRHGMNSHIKWRG